MTGQDARSAACAHGYAPGECPEDGCLYRRDVRNALVGLAGSMADASDQAEAMTDAELGECMTAANTARRRIVVTHTRSLTFDQAEVDAVWNSGVLPIPDYILAGDEATDPDERAIAVYTALEGSLLELFLEQQDDDVSHEVNV